MLQSCIECHIHTHTCYTCTLLNNMLLVPIHHSVIYLYATVQHAIIKIPSQGQCSLRHHHHFAKFFWIYSLRWQNRSPNVWHWGCNRTLKCLTWGTEQTPQLSVPSLSPKVSLWIYYNLTSITADKIIFKLHSNICFKLLRAFKYLQRNTTRTSQWENVHANLQQLCNKRTSSVTWGRSIILQEGVSCVP